MSRQIQVVTPENVEITFELAGLGSRFMAALIDYFYIGLLIAMAGLGLALCQWLFSGLRGTWFIGLAILTLCMIDWSYFIIFETLWSGQTPGKRKLGIRVMREGGFPIDFRSATVRNVMRSVDFLPVFYAFGVVSILAHPENKRLGDMAAGTIMIRERQEEDATVPMSTSFGGMKAPLPLLDFSMLPLDALTADDVAVSRQWLARRGKLTLEVQKTVAQQIARPLLTRLGLAQPVTPDHSAGFLEALVAHLDAEARRSPRISP